MRTSAACARRARRCVTSRAATACRAYGRDLRRLSKRLRALNPAVGLPLLAGLANLLGGGAAKVAVGAAAVAALATTGAVIVRDTDVHTPGDPAPFRLLGIRDAKGRPITRGTPVPEGLSIVTAKVEVAAGPKPRQARDYPTVRLPCPKGMKYAGLQAPLTAAALNTSFDTIVGYSPGALMVITHQGFARDTRFTIGINCRRPDAYGSIHPLDEKFKATVKRGEWRAQRVCGVRRGVALRPRPGGGLGEFVNLGQPVAVQHRNATGTWTRVVAAAYDAEGWIRTSRLCP